MATDIQSLIKNKETILSFLRLNGPSLPVKISKSINASPLFAAAFLAELHTEKKLKMSHMRVGSSPLYYLPEQEKELENFSEYLNEREKEAFQKLKEKKILQDDILTPVERVAIRSLKDFAIPKRIRIGQEIKLFWKHFLTDDQEIPLLLKEKPKIKKAQEPKKETKPKEIETKPQKPIKTIELPQIKTQEIPVPKPKKQKESEFSRNIQEYLKAKDIEVLSTISQKKKELIAKIRIDTPLGKQEIYLIAKDKKKVTEDDITVALQKAQAEKMTSLIISPGEIEKKSVPYLKEWRNLVKFEKINL